MAAKKKNFKVSLFIPVGEKQYKANVDVNLNGRRLTPKQKADFSFHLLHRCADLLSERMDECVDYAFDDLDGN